MKKILSVIIIIYAYFSLCFSHSRYQIIEDFEAFTDTLISYSEEDSQPDDWILDSYNTYNSSGASLKIFGNCYKLLPTANHHLSAGETWSMAVYSANYSNIQAFGITDGYHTLLYSLFGSEELSIGDWITTNQGAFSLGSWTILELPVTDDWLARFDYLPEINGLVFINDESIGSSAAINFDLICNISDDLPVAPQVDVHYEYIESRKLPLRNRQTSFLFSCDVTDPDSDEFTYLWHFGDGQYSTLAEPEHTFEEISNPCYSVLLEVTDESGTTGRGVCNLNLNEGITETPVKINFIGDVMLGREYNSIIDPENYGYLFERVRDLLEDTADITVANLESPITNATVNHPTKPIYLKANLQNVHVLPEAGIDIVTLANNHIFDYMYEGIQDTQNSLNDVGIAYSGAGIDADEAYEPLLYNKNGINMSFLASSDRTGQYNNYQPYLNAGENRPGFAYMTPYYVQKQIREVECISDLVIVELHAGSEYSLGPGSGYDKDSQNDYIDNTEDEEFDLRLDVPQMWDIDIRHFIVDQGADLVICHHPHIIQGLEIYNDKLIAHSLGNFLFDMSYFETKISFILNATASKEGFIQYDIFPVYIDQLRPTPVKGELGNKILSYIADRSRALNTYLQIEPVKPFARIIIDPDTMTYKKTAFRRNVSLYNEEDFYISKPMKLENEGSLAGVTSVEPIVESELRLGRDILWFGGFEEYGVNDWEMEDNFSYNYLNFYSGQRSVKFISGNNNDSVIETCERIRRFRSDSETGLTLMAKTTNVLELEVRVHSYNRNNYSGTDYFYLDISGNEWTSYYVDFGVFSDNIDHLQLEIVASFSNGGECFFDDMSIIEWNDWTPSAEAFLIDFPNNYSYLQFKTTEEQNNVSIVYYEIEPGAYIAEDDQQVALNDNSAPVVTICQNYPNPLVINNERNSITTISYHIAQAGEVSLKLYNIKGQEVKTLVNTCQQKGDYQVSWDGTDNFNAHLPSGIYLYQIKSTEGKPVTKKLVLIR